MPTAKQSARARLSLQKGWIIMVTEPATSTYFEEVCQVVARSGTDAIRRAREAGKLTRRGSYLAVRPQEAEKLRRAYETLVQP